MTNLIAAAGRIRALAWCAVLCCTAAQAGSTLIPVTLRRDLVWDSQRSLLYITTTNGRIERYSPSAGSLLTPFVVGTSLNGADLDATRDYLYVAENAGVGGQGFVRKVDLDTGSPQTLPYSFDFGENGTWDVCIAANGLALVTTRYGGSGWVPLRELDLDSEIFTIRTDVAGTDVRQDTHLHRSADRSLILLMESNISSGPIHVYRSASDSFSSAVNTNTFLSNSFGGISRNAGLVTVDQLDTIVLRTSALAQTGTIIGTSGAHLHDPLLDVLYAIDITTDEVIAIQSVTREELYRVPIGEDLQFPTPFDEGVMAVNHLGTLLFVSTDTGVRVIDLPALLSGDCDENGVTDLCDVDCARTDPTTGLPCTTFPACGLGGDCTTNYRLDACEPDCNANAVADSCDIASMVSADCTGNRIPDECEADCDANGVADSCDIAADPGLDSNENGIHDDCDCLAEAELKLLADDGAIRDRFGTSVALLANHTVVGAYNRGNTGPQATGRGAVYVNEFDGETWDFQQALEDSTGQLGDGLGLSVAAGGNIIVAGAPGDSDNTHTGNGSVVVFRLDEGGWEQGQKLTGSLAGGAALCGYAVAMDPEHPDRLVTGCVMEGTTSQIAFDGIGSAYVFRWTGATWVEEARLVPADGTPNLYYGESVGISGDVVVVGAHRDDTACPANINCNSGAAYVYRRVEGTWMFEQKLTAFDLAQNDQFGGAVAAWGDLIAVGAPTDDDTASATGSVYLYRYADGTWSLEDKLHAADPDLGDSFGVTVALEQDLLLVSATGDDAGATSSGAAYIFARRGGEWVQTDKIIASDAASSDNFGISLALGGGRALIGADGDDDRASSAGAAYLYEGVTGCLAESTGGACCSAGVCTDVTSESACTVFTCNATTNVLPECAGPCGTTCYGDVNGDGFVTAGDRGFVAVNIGLTDAALVCQYDVDGNGFINAGDRGFVAANIGLCAPLPDFQNGSGMNNGQPDSRFGQAEFTAGGTCASVACP